MRVLCGNPRAVRAIGKSDLPPRVVGSARENLNCVAFVESPDAGGVGIGRAANIQPIGGHDRLRGTRDQRGGRGEERGGGEETESQNDCKDEEGLKFWEKVVKVWNH